MLDGAFERTNHATGENQRESAHSKNAELCVMATEQRVNRGRVRNDAARKARAEELAQLQRDCMRLDEFATRVGISHQKAYNLANEGKIPVIAMGREWYVPRRAYERWLDSAWPSGSAPCTNCGHSSDAPLRGAGDAAPDGPEEFEQVAVDEPALLFEPDHLGRREVR